MFHMLKPWTFQRFDFQVRAHLNHLTLLPACLLLAFTQPCAAFSVQAIGLRGGVRALPKLKLSKSSWLEGSLALGTRQVLEHLWDMSLASQWDFSSHMGRVSLDGRLYQAPVNRLLPSGGSVGVEWARPRGGLRFYPGFAWYGPCYAIKTKIGIPVLSAPFFPDSYALQTYFPLGVLLRRWVGLNSKLLDSVAGRINGGARIRAGGIKRIKAWATGEISVAFCPFFELAVVWGTAAALYPRNILPTKRVGYSVQLRFNWDKKAREMGYFKWFRPRVSPMDIAFNGWSNGLVGELDRDPEVVGFLKAMKALNQRAVKAAGAEHVDDAEEVEDWVDQVLSEFDQATPEAFEIKLQSLKNDLRLLKQQPDRKHYSTAINEVRLLIEHIEGIFYFDLPEEDEEEHYLADYLEEEPVQAAPCFVAGATAPDAVNAVGDAEINATAFPSCSLSAGDLPVPCCTEAEQALEISNLEATQAWEPPFEACVEALKG